MNIKLTNIEKQVLYRKYRDEGFSTWDAGERVKQIDEEMKELVKHLKSKDLTDKQINKKFKEEFEKLCMKI